MKRFMTAVSAGALALTIFAGSPIVAQVQTAEAVLDGMAQLGMDIEGIVLTEEQVLQIEAILNGDSEDSGKVAEINALLGND